MNNEMKINTDVRLRKIKNVVRILPLSTLPGFHFNIKPFPTPSTFNMLNNTNDDAKEEK